MPYPSNKVPEFYILIVSDKDGLSHGESPLMSREKVIKMIDDGDYYGSVHAVLLVNSEDGICRNVSMEIAEELADEWISAGEVSPNADALQWVSYLVDRDTSEHLDSLYYSAV